MQSRAPVQPSVTANSEQAQVGKVRGVLLLVYVKGNYFYQKKLGRNPGCAIQYVSTWQALHFLHLL